ncbi:MAG: STAS domain-containing protein [Candidatus Gracilibacteria bacterium]
MFESQLNLVVDPYDTAHSSLVIHLQGEFDKIGLTSIRDKLEVALSSFTGKYLVFDIGDLNFINSEGIGYLIGVYTHVVNISGVFCIVGAKAHVQDVFETLGLWNIIKHPASIEACYTI